MSVAPLLGTDPELAGFELLQRLNARGWKITVLPNEASDRDELEITAHGDGVKVAIDCGTLAEGALILWHALKGL